MWFHKTSDPRQREREKEKGRQQKAWSRAKAVYLTGHTNFSTKYSEDRSSWYILTLSLLLIYGQDLRKHSERWYYINGKFLLNSLSFRIATQLPTLSLWKKYINSVRKMLGFSYLNLLSLLILCNFIISSRLDFEILVLKPKKRLRFASF